MKVSITGLGKAGLPLACVMADAGINVIGLDRNKNIVNKVNSGKNPLLEEPDLGRLIKNNASKRLIATTDTRHAISETDFHIIVVPLLLDSKHQPDFSIIDAATIDVAKNMKRGDTVVVETTLPVGTCEIRIKRLLETHSKLKCGKGFFLGYSPERIMTGHSISRYREFPKIVAGIDKKSGQKALSLYKKFSHSAVLVSNTRVAEMIKISEGVYRDVNIALANELFKMCQEYGIDFWKVREFANHKYCHIHEAGLGVGGHCIPIYPWFLINDFAKKKSASSRLMRTARQINDSMVDYWVSEIMKRAPKNKPRKEISVLIRGLTFRKGVLNVYNSRSVTLAMKLIKLGVKVKCCDDLLPEAAISALGFIPSGKQTRFSVIFDSFAKEKIIVKGDC